MRIKISDVAASQLMEYVNYYASHFSLQAANHLADSFEARMLHLSKFPESGHPEPLAEGLSSLYRSIKIAKHVCVVYYVDETDDSIKVADIWDMRMHPERLKRRLRRKRNY